MRITVRLVGSVLLTLFVVPLLAATSTMTAAIQLAAMTALIMGGTGNPQPLPSYVTAINNRYLTGQYSTYTASGLTTPEQFWPQGLTSLTFDQSVNKGVGILDAAIHSDTTGPTDQVVVVGYSQSATIATIEERNLAKESNAPTPGRLSFILVGNPDNPNGGILERFHGLYIPILDVAFTGATPAGPYPSSVYSIQYDGWADFPKYPLNVLADLNAVLGILTLHPQYPKLTAAQLASAIKEPTTGGSTTYYLIPTANLPILQPLVDLHVPAPIIDLIEPTVRLIVELGYDRTAPANVPAPAQLINPHNNPITLAAELRTAAQQGINAARQDLGNSTPPVKTAADQAPIPASVATTAIAPQSHPSVGSTTRNAGPASATAPVPSTPANPPISAKRSQGDHHAAVKSVAS